VHDRVESLEQVEIEIVDVHRASGMADLIR
jgi:hypothetical protein